MAEIREIIHNTIKVLLYLLPIIVLLLMGYLIYLKLTRNRVDETRQDLAYFTQNLATRYHMTIYKNFDSDFVSYSEYLPGSLKIKRTDNGNEIINRFGGKMIFKESPRTLQERKLYRYLSQNKKTFATRYEGLSAYTILFTELKTQECAHLVITNWKNVSPTFMGLEASHFSQRHPYNGLEKLDFYILEDNDDETSYETLDQGVVSRTPLTMLQAIKACSCLSSNCTVALKFK